MYNLKIALCKSLKDSLVWEIAVSVNYPFASFFLKHISSSNLERVQQISASWLQNAALPGGRKRNKRERDKDKETKREMEEKRTGRDED